MDSVTYSDDQIFEAHDDGSPALYLERGDDGRLYLCDHNERVVVESDEEIDEIVAAIRATWQD